VLALARVNSAVRHLALTAMTLSTKNISRSLLSTGPLLLTLALFGLVWVGWLEIQSARDEFTISHASAFPHHLDMAVLLVIAAIGLIINKRWSVASSVLLCVVAFYVVLVRDFWRMSSNAEVQAFSRPHFDVWWNNFETWKILLSIVSVTGICFGVTRLLTLRRSSKDDVEQLVGREAR
jgi:hypothetical protein